MIKIGIISGSFDLLHFGHVEYLNEASNRFDIVVPIINSSTWVDAWKKREFFMDAHVVGDQLTKVYPNIRFTGNCLHGSLNQSVSDTLIDVVNTLRKRDFNDITFFKMKDRGSGNCPEEKTCFKLGIKFEHLQGKVEQHTSKLYNDFSKRVLEAEFEKWKEYSDREA
jgi:cytidyltransferase-like protein